MKKRQGRDENRKMGKDYIPHPHTPPQRKEKARKEWKKTGKGKKKKWRKKDSTPPPPHFLFFSFHFFYFFFSFFFLGIRLGWIQSKNDSYIERLSSSGVLLSGGSSHLVTAIMQR